MSILMPLLQPQLNNFLCRLYLRVAGLRLRPLRSLVFSRSMAVKMPPKASSSKRKASKADIDESEHEEVDLNGQKDDSQDNGKASKANKKAKTAKEPVKPLDASLPTNITFPINLTLEPKPPGTTRLSTWNVCGINSCIRKGFDFYVKAEDPDILIVTETKTDKEVDNEVLKSRFPVRLKLSFPVARKHELTCFTVICLPITQYRIWGADPKKGQSGTAIFSKIKPKQVKLGLPTLDEEKTQGRCITL
jgi:AP endonuclease-1